MWLLLLLTVPCLAVDNPAIQECFDEAATKYIKCNPVYGRPAVCDCTEKLACHIKMIISKRYVSGSTEYLVNQTFQGPTIVVKQYKLVVVDLSNEMDEDTSIHFHGMRQYNGNWMDGVAAITQYPIPANGKFRYIFRADPHGTHFYHSHVRNQMDNGLFGALIVIEARRNIHEKLGTFEDQPARQTIAIIEQRNTSAKVPGNTFCMPDGSNLPKNFLPLSWIVNGKILPGNIFGDAGSKRLAQFHVVGGKNFRFRIIGATYGAIFIMSIDHHKMYIVATDGYLLKPFETDFLIVHTGERYDFILKAKKEVLPGSTFPIRIQSLAMNCTNHSKLAGQGFAFLVYTTDEYEQDREKPLHHEDLIAQNDRCNNESSPCTIMNCFFKKMPKDFSKPDIYMKCYDVSSLELLYPTPYFKTPSTVESANELFFNFHSLLVGPSMVNGIRFKSPEVPILESKNRSNECKYPVDCKEAGKLFCTHSVHLNQFGHATRFVLSSSNELINQTEPNIIHAIHIHGRQFFVAKIGYPEYDQNGKIKAANKDLKISPCGPAKWRDGTTGNVSVTRNTVRKDTVVIPPGGYVVVHFFQDNPGYWHLHCHMSWHLNHGMAVTIGENTHRASIPPDSLSKNMQDVCFNLKTFLRKESNMSPNLSRRRIKV